MASRPWVMTTRPPKTATCPRCRKSRNRLAVHATFEGKACYSCLMSFPATDRAAAIVATPAITEPVIVTRSAQVRTCPEAGCGRLPAHNGDHRATLHRASKGDVQSPAVIGA